MMRVLLGFILVTTIASAFGDDPAAKEREIQWRTHTAKSLFTNYRADMRPNPARDDDESAVRVTVSMAVMEARKLQDNVLELEINLKQEWYDDRLKFESPRDVEYLPVSDDQKLWTPDTFFVNAQETDRTAHASLFRIYPTGKVLHTKRIGLRTQCHHDLSSYPLVDDLECEIRISSFDFTDDDINYEWKEEDPIRLNEEELDDFAEYELDEHKTEDCTRNISTGSYSCISVYFEFTAPVHNAVIYIYLPSIFVLFFSWLQFWLHKSWSVPRTLASSLPFAIFASLMLFAKLPRSSSVTALDVWLLVCLIMSFLSFVEYVVCLFISRRAISFRDGEKPLLSEREEESKTANKIAFVDSPISLKLDFFSRFIFPLVFIVFIIAYLVYYLTQDE